jgi:hypothetical protein
MSDKKKVVRLSESKLISLVEKMVNKAVKNQEKEWMNEYKEKQHNLLKESSEREFEVCYWTERNDEADYEIIKVKASTPEEAIQKAKTHGGEDVITGRHLVPSRLARKFTIEN